MPLPQGDNLMGIAYGNGMYVAVGEGDHFVYSTNAIDWHAQPFPPLPVFDHYSVGPILFANGQFSANVWSSMFSNSTNTVVQGTLFSSNGLSWSFASNNLATDVYVHSLLNLNGRLFVLAWNKAPLCSSNAVDWVSTVLPVTNTSFNTYWMTYAYDKYLIFGSTYLGPISSQKQVWWSTDGIHYAQTNLSLAGESPRLAGLAHGDGLSVAIWQDQEWLGLPNVCRPYLSTNGVNWSAGPNLWESFVNFRGLFYVHGRFAGFGITTSNVCLLSSTNGTDWDNTPLAVDPDDFANCGPRWLNNQFVAIGLSGLIMTSTNGVQWETRVKASRNNLRDIVCRDGLYVAVGNKGHVFTSPDGIQWTKRSSGTTNQLRSVATGPQRMVAVGDNSTIISSTNGILWLPGSASIADPFGVAHGSNLFVTVGDAGQIVTSPDGLTWQQTRIGTTNERLHGITFGACGWVATGREFIYSGGYVSECLPLVLSSPDGYGWSRQTAPTNNAYLESVAWGGGLYVAVGVDEVHPWSSTIFVSSNAVDWNCQPRSDCRLEAITFGAGMFVAVGEDGAVLSSPDGYHWSPRYFGTSGRNLRSIIYGNGVFTAVGNNETIIQSGSVLPQALPRIRPGGLELGVTGELGQRCTVHASDDLLTWNAVATVTNTTGSATWEDAYATNRLRRFYRISSP